MTIDAEVFDISLDDIDALTEDMENSKSFEISKVDYRNSELVPNDDFSENDALLRTHINEVLSVYNKKFGTSVTFENFQSAVEFAALANEDDKKIRELIYREISANVLDYTVIRGIIVACSVINQQLTIIQRKEYGSAINADVTQVISELFSWLTKLEELKKKVSVVDLEGRIHRIAKSNKKISESAQENKKVIMAGLRDDLKDLEI